MHFNEMCVLGGGGTFGNWYDVVFSWYLVFLYFF